MRSRRYSWKLNKVNKTIRVAVYADRSVELDSVDHTLADTVLRRQDYLQTREEAAWFLSFARGEYDVQKEVL